MISIQTVLPVFWTSLTIRDIFIPAM